MDCRNAQARLNAYLDGELPPGEAALLHEHLRTCAACAAKQEALREVNGNLDLLEGADVPAGFASRVRAVAEGRRVATWQPTHGWLSPYARVAAVLVAMVGLVFGWAMGGAVSAGRADAAPAVVQATDTAFEIEARALSTTPPDSLAAAYLAWGGGDI